MSLSNCSIVTRAWLLLGAIISILAIGILTTWLTNSSVRNTTDRLVTHDYDFQLKVLDLQLHIVQVQQWLTDISATRGQDGLDDGYAEAEKHAASAYKLIEEISLQDPENSAFYREMRTTFDSYYQTGKKMAGLYVAEGPASGNAFMETFDKAAESMSASLDKVLQRAAEGATNRVADIQHTSARATAINLGISLIILVSLLGGMLYLINLLKPLQQIRQSTVQLADNDLTFDITPLEGTHEIAVLTSSFARMKGNLKHSIHEIGTVATTITETTRTMSSVAEQTLQGVSSQNQEIEQIATAINQMAATVQEISRSTAAAAQSAHQANDAVGEGGQVIEKAVAATRRLADEVSHGADVVSQLREESESIDKVLVVIRGIAEQTNLLALNAAIEAARAGEQGRGFAVVADEVRSLASKTQDSTKEIQQMIERLQAGSSEAAAVMSESREKADITAQLAADAGKSLVQIRDQVSRINEMSVQIATASEEQGSVAQEIHRNIEGIRVISEQTTAAAQKTSEASDSLSDQAATLHDFVGRFKV